MIYIINGAPCSGKTTYVSNHIKPNDIVWDWDAVECAISGNDYQDKNPNLNRLMKKMRRLIIDEILINNAINDKYIIVTQLNQNLIDELALVDSVRIITLDTDKATCLERLNNSNRIDKDELITVVDEWHRKHNEFW